MEVVNRPILQYPGFGQLHEHPPRSRTDEKSAASRVRNRVGLVSMVGGGRRACATNHGAHISRFELTVEVSDSMWKTVFGYPGAMCEVAD